MRKTLTLLLLVIVVVEASIIGAWFGRWFGWKQQKGSEESTVDKGIDYAAEALKKAKNTAYDTFRETESKVKDFGSSAWETVYEGYTNAWVKYNEAKRKLSEWTNSALSKTLQAYETAKETFKEKVQAMKDYLLQYKDKTEERFEEKYLESYGLLDTGFLEAKQTLDEARRKLYALYENMYNQAIEDYQASAQYLNDASGRLKRWTESKTKGKNYEEIKKKLEEGRDKAREYYRESLDRATKAKQTLEDFNKDWSESARETFEMMKQRSEEAAETLKSYQNDAKAKTNASYETIKNKLQEFSNKAAENLRNAELDIQQAKDSLKKYSEDTLASIKVKFANLKDEL